jgi:hypothetical protein
VFAPYFNSATTTRAPRAAALRRQPQGVGRQQHLQAAVPPPRRRPLRDRRLHHLRGAGQAPRRRDPVYGCVAQIFALQQQVAILQAQLVHCRPRRSSRAASRAPRIRLRATTTSGRTTPASVLGGGRRR